MATLEMEDTINRALKLSARLHWPHNSVTLLEQDAAAECRWWNSLEDDERNAYVRGARLDNSCARTDWLDIGEAHRQHILDAARAVECWFNAGQ